MLTATPNSKWAQAIQINENTPKTDELHEMLSSIEIYSANKTQKIQLKVFESFFFMKKNIDNKLEPFSIKYRKNDDTYSYSLLNSYATTITVGDYGPEKKRVKSIVIEIPLDYIDNIKLINESTRDTQSLKQVYTLCKMLDTEDRSMLSNEANSISHRYIIPNYTNLSRCYIDTTHQDIFIRLVLIYPD